MSKPGKSGKRWLKRLAVGVGGLVMVLLLLPVLALLALNSPWGRDALESYVGDTLSTTLKGEFALSGLSEVGPSGLSGLDIQVRDSQGHEVLDAQGLDVRWSLVELLRQLVDGAAPLVVRIPNITLDHVEVKLIPTAEGQPSLADAFLPTEPSSGSEDPGRPLSLRFEQILLKHAWLHGNLNGTRLDAEIEPLSTSLVIDPNSMQLDLEQLTLVVRQGAPVDNLRVEADAQLSVPTSDPTRLDGRLHLKGEFDQPAASPRGSAPPRASFDVSVDADTGKLQSTVQARLAEMSASVQGLVSLTENQARDVRIEISRLDLANWLGAPPTQLSLKATGQAAWGEQLSASLSATLPQGNRVDGFVLPGIEVQGQFREEELRASVQASDGSVSVKLSSKPAHEPNARQASLRAELHDLPPALQRLLGEVTLRGHARASADVVLRQPKNDGEPELLRAEASLSLDGLAVPNVQIGSAQLSARAKGPLLSPNLELDLTAQGLTVSGQSLNRVHVQASGQMGALAIEADVDRPKAPRVHASVRYRVGEPRVKDVRLVSRVQNRPIELRVAEVRFGSGIEIDSAELKGAGTLSASATIGNNTVQARAQARSLDLRRLTQLVGPGLDLEGRVSLDTQIALRGQRVEGHVRGEAIDFRLGSLHCPRASVFLRAQDQRLSGEVAALAQGVGRLSVELDELRLPNRFDTFQPKQLTGAARLFLHADLKELGELLPPQLVAGVDPEGSLEISGHFSRAERGVPLLDLKTSVRGLRWSPPRDTHPVPQNEHAVVEGAPAFRWNHGDVTLLLSHREGEPLSVSLELLHPENAQPLIQADLSTRLHDPNQLWALQEVDWLAQPLKGSLRIDRLSTDRLPPSIPVPGGASATVSLNAKLDGALRSPTLQLDAELEDLAVPQAPNEQLDVSVQGRISPASWSANVRASNASRALASASARGAWSSPLAQDTGASFRVDTVEVKADRLPLEALGAMVEMPLDGDLNVDVLARDLSGDPSVQGTLWSGGVSVAQLQPQRLRVSLSADSRKLEAQAEIKQPKGEMRATVQAPVAWQDALPTVDQSELVLGLKARHFDLGFLHSLRTEGVHSIRGILDADVRRDPAGQGVGEGTVSLSKGQLQIDALGQRLENVEARLRLDAKGRLELERLEAHSRGGRLHAKGVAQLEGAALQSAKLEARIPKGAPFPLTVGGSSLGEIWGKVEMEATESESATEVEVNVPRLYLELPEFSGGDLQSLDEPANIAVGVYLDDERFVTLPIPPPDETVPPKTPEKPKAIQIDVNLGDEIWISRGNQIRARLDGGVRVEIAAETSVVGEVSIVRGSLDVQGREFTVSDGSVTFEENSDPSNPVVVATATYEAPNDIEIYARFVGPVKSGSLTLSSSPPLSQSEILNVLLFGTTEPTPAAGGGGGNVVENTAVAAGGALVTKGLNSQLRELTTLEVETRVDEVDGQMRPELAVRLSPRITAELSYALSVPESSQSTDRTFVTLDVRVGDRWTLQTTLGDQGTVLADMLWRLRY